MQPNPIGLKLSIIDRAFKKRMDDYAKELGLTSVQFRVLSEISRLEECGLYKEINQKDLEKLEKVSHPTMSSIIHQLERKGFIECSEGKMDRRFKSIRCSGRAAHITDNMAQYDMEVFNELAKGMDEEQKEAFLRSIDHIMVNISKTRQPLK